MAMIATRLRWNTIARLAGVYDPAFFTVFPLRSKQERDRFDLLRQAYVRSPLPRWL